MTGTRGPIPDRSEDRIRRNAGDPIETVTAIGPVPVPELDIGLTHPLVDDLYRSLGESAQARFFEPSDWQIARFTLDQLNKELLYEKGVIGAMKLSAFFQAFSTLMMTEGDRRRLRIEIQRKTEGEQTGEVLSFADAMRARVSGKPQ